MIAKPTEIYAPEFPDDKLIDKAKESE